MHLVISVGKTSKTEVLKYKIMFSTFPQMPRQESNAESGDQVITIIVIINHHRTVVPQTTPKGFKSGETQPSELIQV